jgi:hypothetical protein
MVGRYVRFTAAPGAGDEIGVIPPSVGVGVGVGVGLGPGLD